MLTLEMNRNIRRLVTELQDTALMAKFSMEIWLQ